MNDTPHTAPPTSGPAWLDTQSILPAEFRARIRAALDAARELQQATDAFVAAHGSVFKEYAALESASEVPPDVWEVLDRTSGYATLWILVLAAESALGTMLETPPPAAITPLDAGCISS